MEPLPLFGNGWRPAWPLALCLLAAGNARAQDAPGAGLCPADAALSARPVVDAALEAGDIYINADNISATDQGLSRLQGNVEFAQDRRQARADEVLYNRDENNADFSGNVQYWDETLYLGGGAAQVELDDSTGRFMEAEYYLLKRRGRGRAEELFAEADKLTKGKNINYTTCALAGAGAAGRNFWELSASELTLNHETERGSGRNIVLKIKGVPALYAPYFTFPLSRERKSGFLMPGYGASRGNGLELRLPYYWNIAPNMDATFTPRVITDNGVMAMAEYRYLLDSGRGALNLEYLPDDDHFNGRDRSFIRFQHNQRLFAKGRLSLLYNRVSDREYLEDFGNQLINASRRFLPRRADLRWRGNKWNLLARLRDYQVVDRSISATSRPYKTLPRVRFRYAPLSGNNRLNVDFVSEAVYFDRADDLGLDVNVTGLRADLYPSVRFPLRSSAAFFIPRAGLRYTRYDLDERGPFEKNPERTLPIVSVDSGLFLEREARFAGGSYLHTLEPRLYYLYIPYKDQTHLPVFDSASLNLNYDAPFTDDRLAGTDRIGDANRLALGVASRLISSETGRQTAFARVMQFYLLEDQKVFRQRLNAQGELEDLGTLNTDLFSPVVAEAGAMFGPWNLKGEFQWDPNENTALKKWLRVQYQPASDRVFNFSYRAVRSQSGQLRRNLTDIEQTDLSFRWPINLSWSVVGRWNYAIPEGRSPDLFAGVEYQSCCFGIRVVGRRYLTNLEGDFNTGVFLQLELKGLAGVGRNTVDFLHQAIPGYESEF